MHSYSLLILQYGKGLPLLTYSEIIIHFQHSNYCLVTGSIVYASACLSWYDFLITGKNTDVMLISHTYHLYKTLVKNKKANSRNSTPIPFMLSIQLTKCLKTIFVKVVFYWVITLMRPDLFYLFCGLQEYYQKFEQAVGKKREHPIAFFTEILQNLHRWKKHWN